MKSMKGIVSEGCFYFILTVAMVLMFCFSVTPALAKAPSHMGYKRCIGCHKQQDTSWKDGTMNTSAFEALLPGYRVEGKNSAGLDPNKDYSANPECLGCHATGYGKPGGFKNYLETPNLAGVTCEACHGPGEKYWKVMAKNRHFYKKIDLIMKGYTLPNQATCDKCHTEGCPTESSEMDFDSEAAHDNFPLKGKH